MTKYWFKGQKQT